MNHDSFFTKGDSHKVCQDYAISEETDQFVYAIVCDGCSSSPKVDIGARMLAELFAGKVRTFDLKFVLENYKKPWPEYFQRHLEDGVKAGLQDVAHILDLQPASFDATLLAAIYVKEQDTILTFQWGDGVITRIDKDGAVEQAGIVYSSNAPAYFSYQVWDDRGQQYAEYFKSQRATLIRKMTGYPDTPMENNPSFFQWFAAKDVKIVHLTSDGIESFQDVNQNRIDVASEFTAFKSVEGEFVQRRMNRLLKTIKKDGSGHYDDLGVAAIAFD